VQAYLGASLFAAGLGWYRGWIGVATLGALLLIDAALEDWRMRR